MSVRGKVSESLNLSSGIRQSNWPGLEGNCLRYSTLHFKCSVCPVFGQVSSGCLKDVDLTIQPPIETPRSQNHSIIRLQLKHFHHCWNYFSSYTNENNGLAGPCSDIPKTGRAEVCPGPCRIYVIADLSRLVSLSPSVE